MITSSLEHQEKAGEVTVSPQFSLFLLFLVSKGLQHWPDKVSKVIDLWLINCCTSESKLVSGIKKEALRKRQKGASEFSS